MVPFNVEKGEIAIATDINLAVLPLPFMFDIVNQEQ